MLDPRRLLVASLALSLASWCTSALAQTPSLALDRLRPAPAGDPFFTVESPSSADNRLSVQLIGAYARSPLVLKTGDQQDPVVRYQAMAHAGAAWELGSRLKLDLLIPLTFAQGGDSVSTGSYQMPEPKSAALGEPRVGARVTLVRQLHGWPAVAVSFRAFVPLGGADAYSGSNSIRYEPAMVMGASWPSLVWSVSLSRLFRASDGSYADVAGSEYGLAGGIAARRGPWQIGPELYASTTSDGRTPAFQRATTDAEALLGARWNAGPLSVGLAGGPGLTRGIGTPSYRILAAVRWSSAAEADPSRSTSHSQQAADARPPSGSQTAPPPSHRPRSVILDNDGDRVPNELDACPEVAGDARPEATRRGCPPDQDGDGIADGDDHCPTERGAPNPDPQLHGCPVDSDGDGIVDGLDACPSDKGPRTQDPATNGCPTAVRIVGPQIVIQQQILFETGSDRLKPESVPTVRAVADLMIAHPDLARIAIDGHTDNAGAPAQNLQLSQRRAVAIMRWLTDHGVDARRLETRAFGARRPIADNKTVEGRASNRRVEFQIRKRSPAGEADWSHGPVD